MIQRRHSRSSKRCWIVQGSLLIPLVVVFGRVDHSESRSFDLPSKARVQNNRQTTTASSTTTTTIARNVRLPNFPWEWPLSLVNRTGIDKDDSESAIAESSSTTRDALDDDEEEQTPPLDWDDFDHNSLEGKSEPADSDLDRQPSTEESKESATTTRSATFPESSSLSTPVVYRYYGRNRARLHSAGSIPFILLGPSVDHWKNAAQLLAARGFSVIACERVLPSDDNNNNNNAAGNNNNNTTEEGANVVLAILDALRWTRVVLVGCDRESALAMQAALQLAPQRIAGLVLCGDLQEAYRLVASLQPSLKSGGFALDYFLQSFLESPFTIIWDGEMQVENDAFRDTSSGNRCLILGGGLAPHRRRPEQFAWALTRFVEQKVAPTSLANQKVDAQARRENATAETANKRLSILPMSLQEILSPGTGLLVSGRVVASIIFYFTALRVALYQYENFRHGLMGIKSKYDTISSVQRRVLLFVRDFVVNFGYLSRLWGFLRPRAISKKSSSDDEDVQGPKSNEGNAKEDKVDDPGQDSNEEEKGGEDAPTDEFPNDYQPEFKPSFFLDQVIA